MSEISRQKATEITAEIKAAVEAVLSKHGMTISSARNTYGAAYSIKIEAAESQIDANGINHASPEAAMYGHAQMRAQFGLVENLVGRKFAMSGEEFRFVGISVKKSRYPLIARLERDRSVCQMPPEAAAFINGAR